MTWLKKFRIKRRIVKLCKEHGLCPVHGCEIRFWNSKFWTPECPRCIQDAEAAAVRKCEEREACARSKALELDLARKKAAVVVLSLKDQLNTEGT
jgi:hypothetical protein